MEACRAEYQFSLQEHRQLVRYLTRNHPDERDVLSFCSSQAGFRARQHLYNVYIVSNHERCIAIVKLGLFRAMFQVFQMTAFVFHGPSILGEKFTKSLDGNAVPDREVRDVLLCVQDFVQSSHSTHRSFLSESCVTKVSKRVVIADNLRSSPVYGP